MPRDATHTRERLLRAAEYRFARDGVAGARLRDIVRDAGQANDSAVGYHFGSREGLLAAVVERHIARMEVLREPTVSSLPDASLDEVVAMVVQPTAAMLRSTDGRDFLRITEQLAGYAGVRTGRPSIAIRGTVLAAQLGRIEDLLTESFGRSRARERVATMVTFLTASLAERARAVERGPVRASHRRYVEELVTMLSGAASAQR